MLVLSPSLATSQVRIYMYGKNVDMRRSFDGLQAIIQSEFKKDVRLGDLFLFLNRRSDRIKLMYWDQDGFCIFYKRLEIGTYQRPVFKLDCNHVEMDRSELMLLLSGIDLQSAKRRKRYVIDAQTRALLGQNSA